MPGILLIAAICGSQPGQNLAPIWPPPPGSVVGQDWSASAQWEAPPDRAVPLWLLIWRAPGGGLLASSWAGELAVWSEGGVTCIGIKGENLCEECGDECEDEPSIPYEIYPRVPYVTGDRTLAELVVWNAELLRVSRIGSQIEPEAEWCP